MSVLIVAIRQATTNLDEIETYKRLVDGTLIGPRTLVASSSTRCEVLEGKAADAITIVRFPSRAAASRWFQSDAYQEVARHRKAGGRYQILMVDASDDVDIASQ